MHEYELYGASLFETLLAKRGHFWKWPQHWQRLCQSAQNLGFQSPSFDATLASILAAHDSSQVQVLRLTLQRTGGLWQGEPLGQTTSVLARSFQHSPGPAQLHLPHQRLACNDPQRQHKTGSRIFYQHLLAQAALANRPDCLLIDAQNRILETCNANVLWCTADQWFTPATRLGLLPGICRQWLLEDQFIQESVLTLAQLENVEGFLICNSVHGVRPVSAIGDQRIDMAKGLNFIEKLPMRIYEPITQMSGS